MLLEGMMDLIIIIIIHHRIQESTMRWDKTLV